MVPSLVFYDELLLRYDCIRSTQNTFYTKCINVIIDSIGPSIILRSIYMIYVERHVSKL